MKLFIRLFIIALLSYYLSMFMPWWIIGVIGFVVGLVLPGSSINAFISGFLGAGLVWMATAWKLDADNESAFSTIILEIIPLGDPITLIAATGLIGGLCGGLSTTTGSLFRQNRSKKQTDQYYR